MNARESKQNRSRYSLSNIVLIQAALAIIIPFAIILPTLLYLASHYVKQSVNEQHTALAVAVTGQSRNFIHSAANNIRLLASILSDNNYGDHSIKPLFDNTLKVSSAISSLILTNPQGVVKHIGLPASRQATRNNFIGMDLTRQPHIKNTLSSHQEHWSSVFLSAIDGGTVVALSVPFTNGILTGEIQLQELSSKLDSIRSNDRLTLIFDRQGHILAHPNADLSAQQISLLNIPLIRNTIRENTIISGHVDILGKEYHATAVPISDLGWYTLMGTPVDTLRAPLRFVAQMIFLGLMAASGIALLLIGLSIQRTAKMVAQYETAARHITHGNYTVSMPDSVIEEFANLGNHIQGMAEAIDSREQQLRDSERQFRAFYDAGLVGLALIDLKGDWIRLNKTLTRLLGDEEQNLAGHNWLDIIHPDYLSQTREGFSGLLKQEHDGYELQNQIVTPSGTYSTNTVLRMVYGENRQPRFITLMLQDITEQKNAEAQIEKLAYFDPLTDLPNRRLFMDRLHHAMQLSGRNGRYCAVLFLDLDHFKDLNDTAGHDIGDQLLIMVADRLKTYTRDADTVARLGGDEFVIMIEDLDEDEHRATQKCQTIAEQVMTAFSHPFELLQTAASSTCSIGVFLFIGDELSSREILKRADAAMYQAKKAGRAKIRFFDPELQDYLEQRTGLINDLRLALQQEQLYICLQPILDNEQTILGAEVLLRWRHPEQGEISPDQFIPLAEETALIEPIGNWVLKQAANTLKEWKSDPGTAGLYLSVNVSPHQFRSQNFVSTLQTIIHDHTIAASQLHLELTETVLLNDLEGTRQRMQQLKSLGVSLSLDDFGTGYSSLEYLKHLPFDHLKIDKTFTMDIGIDSTSSRIINVILDMGRLLDIEIIAEGVETDAQRAYLLEQQCRKFQGFYFSRPIPKDEFRRLLPD